MLHWRSHAELAVPVAGLAKAHLSQESEVLRIRMGQRSLKQKRVSKALARDRRPDVVAVGPEFCLAAKSGLPRGEARVHGGARDIALYFVHWLTDLVGTLTPGYKMMRNWDTV